MPRGVDWKMRRFPVLVRAFREDLSGEELEVLSRPLDAADAEAEERYNEERDEYEFWLQNGHDSAVPPAER